MLAAGGGGGPFAGGARAGMGSGKPGKEAAARRLHDIAGGPVAPLAMSVREVMTAHGLGIAREAARPVGGAGDGAYPAYAAARACGGLTIRRVSSRSGRATQGTHCTISGTGRPAAAAVSRTIAAAGAA